MRCSNLKPMRAKARINVLTVTMLFACLSHSTTVRAESGLDFPGNGGVTTTMRFRFVSPHLNGLPMYGNLADAKPGVTYIWKAYYRPQTGGAEGYMTNFFYSSDAGSGTLQEWFDSGSGDRAYGFHPYPVDSNGNGDRFETARHIFSIADGSDFPAGRSFWQDFLVTYERWYTHVVRIINNGGGNITFEFYVDYENDPSKVISKTYANRTGLPDNPVLTFGDAPHAPGQEVVSGIHRYYRIYSQALELAEIDQELTNARSSATGAASFWYINDDPTPTDIMDKSGKGNDPRWVGDERPGLYRSADNKIPRPPENLRASP